MLVVKKLPANVGNIRDTCSILESGISLGQEEGMETDSSIPAPKIPWTEEPGKLQSIGSNRVRRDWRDLACRFVIAFLPRSKRLLISWMQEKAMAPHSSTLAWEIPWKEEPGRLRSTRSLRVGHDWETSLSLFTFMHWRRKWQPLQCSCLENPRDGGAWWAAVYGVAQSQTRLKWLSSSSSSSPNTHWFWSPRK